MFDMRIYLRIIPNETVAFLQGNVIFAVNVEDEETTLGRLHLKAASRCGTNVFPWFNFYFSNAVAGTRF